MSAILQVPHRALLMKAAPVDTFGQDLKRLCAVLFGLMKRHRGLGLAAPQIGVLRRVIAISMGNLIMVNPRLLEHSTETSARLEGCLSLPTGLRVSMRRPLRVRVAWQTIDGADRESQFEGLASACVQHEMDHLDGRLIG